MDETSPPKASAEVLPELAAFLAPFAPLLHNAQSRHSLHRYLTGLLSDLPRKNCDTIAATVAGTSPERLQHLLTDALWEAQALDEARVRWLSVRSPAGGILLLDETSLPKKGDRSPGVAAQYCGTLGKIANCQVVVSAEYVVDLPATSQPLHWPVSAQLFLPEAWMEDPARRAQAHIPDTETVQTKPERALALLDQARRWGVPFSSVVADAGYGDTPAFLAALEERGVPYVCGVASDFGVRLPDTVAAAAAEAAAWAQAPARVRLAGNRGGRGQPKKPRPAPLQTVAAVVDAQPADAWQTVTWRDGSRDPTERTGTLGKQFVAVRVHWATGGAHLPITDRRVSTGPEGWLLGERPLPGITGERKYYVSSLPADTSLSRLVELAHARWAIEQFYEDAKGECGLGDYQGRRWDGLQRHLALVMLAYSFLAVQALPPLEGGTVAGAAGAFPPGAPAESAGGTSPGPGVAVPGSGALAHRDQPNPPLSPSEKLTQ
jgi:SRSO17 transposase